MNFTEGRGWHRGDTSWRSSSRERVVELGHVYHHSLATGALVRQAGASVYTAAVCFSSIFCRVVGGEGAAAAMAASRV
mgnify:CR=1 FL=1